MRSKAVFSTTFSLLLLVATAARADEETDARADALFQEGRALMKDGRFAEACPKLEESQRLGPSGGTLLNVAVCHERVGRVATAWTEFQAALTAARTEGKEDRARLAEERILVLQPRLPWLTLAVPESARAGLRVELDGAEIVPLAFGREMPVDPGHHRILVIAPGRPPQEIAVHMAEGDRRTVSLAGAIAAAAEPAPPIAPIAAPAPVAPPLKAAPAPEHARSRGRIVFEIGAFAGLLHGDVAAAQPDDEGSVLLRDQTGAMTSCASAGCDYSFGELESLAAGGTGFLGYALTERVHLGFRGMGGLRLGGGFMVAVGPGVSTRVLGPIWAGASFMVGDLVVRGEGTVVPHGVYTAIATRQELWMTTGLTVGNGIELGLAIVENDSGALFVQTTPVFLIGSKDIAVTLPVSLAYRFF